MRDLWNFEIEPVKIETPMDIVKEQCELLHNKTGGLIKCGIVDLNLLGRSDFFSFKVYLTSKNTPNYSFEVFRLSHSIEIYPVKIMVENNDLALELKCEDALNKIICVTEEEFIFNLRLILNSDKVKTVIFSLLAMNK